jgi:hypothetical protein
MGIRSIISNVVRSISGVSVSPTDRLMITYDDGSQQDAGSVADPTADIKFRGRFQTATNGTLTVTFPAGLFASAPTIMALVEAPSGSTGTFHLQADGAATTTQAKFKVTGTLSSTVSLIGLTILSINATPGALWVNVWASDAT